MSELSDRLTDTDLLARVANDAALMAAWQNVRESDLADGYLSREARTFERRALDELSRIRAELAEGTWEPGRVRRFPLPDCPDRIITVSTIADRVVERAIAQAIGPAIDDHLSPFSFGYRRGLGTRDALNALWEAAASGWSHVLRTDIEQAFDSIPRQAALDALAQRITDARVVDLVARLLARLDAAGLTGIGIPQGSAVSPLLLNIYLDPIDREILAAGFLPIRYADDLAIPVSGESEGLALIDRLGTAFAELALRLNANKTTVAAFDDGVEFLNQRIRPVGTPDDSDDYAHPRRISQYVLGSGALVRLRSDHVRVDRDGQTVASTHLSRVRQLVLGGRVGLTTPLLHRAAEKGIDIVLMTEHGGYVARLGRRRGGDVRVRQAQFRRAEHQDECLRLAGAFVAGKIANMRVAILRDARRRNASQIPRRDVRRAEALEHSAAFASQAISHTALLGLEGSAARSYFTWIADCVPADWAFQGRNRRPPRDPINAMLSFGYTLLAAEAVSACEVAGLDPDLGYLHSARWGRPSLALDIMEEWRPVLVDCAVLGLVRAGSISPADFVSAGERGCRMQDKARRAFLAAYERRMLTLASSTVARGRRPYRELLAIHARSLADHLVDTQTPYEGYRWR